MNETWRATSAGLDIYYFKVTNLINQVLYSPNQRIPYYVGNYTLHTEA